MTDSLAVAAWIVLILCSVGLSVSIADTIFGFFRRLRKDRVQPSVGESTPQPVPHLLGSIEGIEPMQLVRYQCSGDEVTLSYGDLQRLYYNQAKPKRKTGSKKRKRATSKRRPTRKKLNPARKKRPLVLE